MRRTGKKLTGRGTLHCGNRRLGSVRYTLYLSTPGGEGTVVEFGEKPKAGDGDLLHLTLEDGRVVNCQLLDNSPYCAIVGYGPLEERRHSIRTDNVRLPGPRRRR